MSLSLSTLTNASTSASILTESATKADFLDAVPILKNEANLGNRAKDAKQTTALKQPRALPLDANGKGYLHLSGVTGNYATVPHSADFNGITDFVMEAKDVYMSNWATGTETFFSKFGSGGSAFTFRRNVSNVNFSAVYGSATVNSNFAHGITGSAIASIRLTRVGTAITAELDSGSGYVSIGTSQTVPSDAIASTTSDIAIGARDDGVNHRLRGKISRARIWKNSTASGTPVLDIDFTDSTVAHGASSFTSGSGQTVTIHKSGQNPAKIIRRSVLRFVTSAGSSLRGQLNRTITDGGYYFAVFSINGDGGNAASRVFAINSTNQNETANTGFVYAIKKGSTNDLASYYGGYRLIHNDFYDEDKGSFLHEVKVVNNAQSSSVDNAGQKTSSTSISNLSAEEFAIGCENNANQTSNPSIDLEFLALFNPNSIPNEQIAQKIRDYIANRATS